MLKPIIAATALVALAGTSFVYAQQGFGGQGNPGGDGPRFEHRHLPSPADITAFCPASSKRRPPRSTGWSTAPTPWPSAAQP